MISRSVRPGTGRTRSVGCDVRGCETSPRRLAGANGGRRERGRRVSPHPRPRTDRRQEVSMAKVVLVTGVSRYLGGLFARRLSNDPSVERILGVDVVPPRHSIGRAEFVRADIRNPMIGRIMAQAAVDTVVHMNVIATPRDTGGRVTQKEINVIGTMQLLAACQKSESVSRLVVKSSAAVYGSSPRDPAMFSEDMNPKTLPRTGFGKDSVEVEG